MYLRLTLGVAIALLAAIGLEPAARAGQQSGLSSREQQLISEFNRHVQDYVELHRRLEGPVPTVQVSSDPAEIRRAILALARKIRAERSHARRGVFFTPDLAPLFRRLIAEGCGGAFDDLYAVANEENPYLASWRPRVNSAYPEAAPLSMMSPNILCRLPELPPELEFRFWDRCLILRDHHANLVVDYLPAAIPIQTTTRR